MPRSRSSAQAEERWDVLATQAIGILDRRLHHLSQSD
jgi:hypothetical protein